MVRKTEGDVEYGPKFEAALGLTLDGEKLSPKNVVALESELLTSPNDVKTRLLLIGYYSKEAGNPSFRQSYLKHRMWLVEKFPKTEFNLDYNPYGFVAKTGPEYQALKAAWLKQVELNKDSPDVIVNAVHFLRVQDLEIADNLLQKWQQREPDNYKWASERAKLYTTQARTKEGDEKNRFYALSVEQFEKALALNKKERSFRRDSDRSSLLQGLSEAAFHSNQLAKAKTYATERLLEFGRDPNNIDFSSIAHDGNIMLGRIALREGDIAKAKEHLLIAGRIANLAIRQMRTWFTPWMILAKELFDKNEKQVVIEFLELCAQAKSDNDKIFRKWIAIIRKGETPSFDIYERWNK